jgi:hypothetical protein
MPFAQYKNGGTSNSKWGSSSSVNTDPYSVDKLTQQIDNANVRIKDAGFAPQNTDKRNGFEKFLNLPQNQNWFFDTLEVLGRPGNAVKNVLDKAVGTGAKESIGEAALKGISGREKVSGAQMVKDHLGIENGFSKFLLGTALDIGTDPLTFVPGGVLAKGVTAPAKLAGKAVKGVYNATESLVPGLKTLRETKIEPALQSAKDGLGYAFNPNYKIDETLNGGKSTALQDLSQSTDNSRAFMQEEAMKNLANTAKSAGGIDTGVNVGRVMEAPLKQFDSQYNLLDGSVTDNADELNRLIQDRYAAIRTNPVPEVVTKLRSEIDQLKSNIQNPIQTELPRPVRDMPTDPKIQQAAKTLVESNNTIREFAVDNGIDIPAMEGYMTHVWSQAERDARKINKPVKIDAGAFGQGNPNKNILKQRELMGSVEDINDKIGKPKFEPNAYFASGIGQKRLIDYVHAVKLRKEVLQNPDFSVPFIKGMDVPKNAEVIDSNNYTFLKESGDALDGIVPTEKIGGQYIVTKQAKMALDRYQKLNTDEGTKAFLKAFDGIQSLWKKGALFSLGYHFRNQAGATFNNYVAGMNTLDLARYTPEAFKEVSKSISGKESALFTEYRKQGLGSNTLSQVEFAKVGQEPEQAIQKTVDNMSKDTKGQIKQRLNPLNAFQTSQEVGNFFDQANRFALYKWAKDKGMTPEQAAAKVREVQFDYSKTTPFEKNIATRVFPFYRWMRNNIPFQIKTFINDPRKYEYLNKARLNAQEAVGLNENNIPDYMKEQFAIPLYGQNGKGKMLGLNLPLTDLTKLSKPGKTLVDAVTPLVKTPAELALNYNTFFGKKIQKFDGEQKQYQIPYTDIAFGVPVKGAYAFEQATGQIGRGFSGFLQKPDTKDQDIVNRLPSLGISSLTKPFDAEKYAYYEKLDQLKQLQDLMLFIQQQTGEKPRTLNQIKR